MKKNLTKKLMSLKIAAISVTVMAFSLFIPDCINEKVSNSDTISFITVNAETDSTDLLCSYLSEDKTYKS